MPSSEESQMRYWLQLLANGERSVEQVFQHLVDTGRQDQCEDSSVAAGRAPAAIPASPEVRMDMERARRCGYPEVIYAPGKTAAALVGGFQTLLAQGQAALATRCDAEQAASLCAAVSGAIHNPVARTVRCSGETPSAGRVVVVTAGTSDRPVAEEAIETLLWMGIETELLMDVGVAGPQRFLREKHRLEGAQAIVVVAGMEGALPSVVAGWVACPVVAVPTSIGYGTALGGVAALLSMLNSCAANVAVVNIDAGFKGAYLAGMIARQSVAGAAAFEPVSRETPVAPEVRWSTAGSSETLRESSEDSP